MSTSISQQEQQLRAQIAEATGKMARIEGQLHVLDGELSAHLNQQARYQSLEEICPPIEKLGSADAASLFAETTGHEPEKLLQQIRAAVAGFRQKTSAIEHARGALQAEFREAQTAIQILNEQLAELHERAERLEAEAEMFQHGDDARSHDLQFYDMPYRVLPWSVRGEDERRFHHLLAAFVLAAVAFGGIVPFFRAPVELEKGVVVPERIARIIKKKQEAKQEEQKRIDEQLAAKKAEAAEDKPAEKTDKPADKPAEKIAEKPAEKIAETAPEKAADAPSEKTATATPSAAKPVDQAVQAIRRSAESKGVLAFKNDFAELLKDTAAPKMGADAQISVSAKRATGDALQRSIIVSQATGGSGGIDTAAINRKSEGTVTQRITETEVKIAKVESKAAAVASAAGSSAGAASAGAGKSSAGARSDEEIQLVFDQSKSALYRIYNRELRSNPSLRGKMVLRVVIEPDGRVSKCTVDSSDLASPSLTDAIVERVMKFNFGPKEGAPAITILYPIEFLPPN